MKVPKADAVSVALVAAAVLGLVSIAGASSEAQAMDETAIVLGVIGVVAAAALAVRPQVLAPRSRLGIAVVAFVVWLFVAASVSGRGWSAFMGQPMSLLGWLTVAAVTLVAAAASTRGEALRRMLEAVAPFVVFAQTAATLVQLAMMAKARGSLPNSTYLGEALVLLLPFALAEESGAHLSRTARYSLVGASIVALVASGSRVAGVVAIAWFVWVLVKRTTWAARTKTLATAGLLVAVVAAGLVFARAEVLGSAGVETLGERPQMWSAAATAVAARPLVGYGPDGFVAGGASVTTPELALTGGTIMEFRTGAVDPHSLPVWVAVSGGLVGLALFLWGAVEVALAWRARARAGEDVAPEVWAVMGAVAIFCTAPAALQVLPLFAVVLGMSLARPHAERVAAGGASRVAGWAVAAVLGGAALVLAANAATRMSLENHGPEVSPGRTTAAQSASDLWRFDPHLAYLASLHWGWAVASDPGLAASLPDLAAIQRAFELDGRDPFIALERARTMRFHGSPASSIDAAFLDAFERWPLYPLARAEYALFLAETARPAEAREQLRIARIAPITQEDVKRAVDEANAAITAGGE